MYKTGSKSFVTKIAASSKKIILKPNTSTNKLYMNKFIIGFNVTDNAEKNCILPDAVELYGGNCENEGVPVGIRKIGDLVQVDDQNFVQFGVRLFAINFDCIKRQYRNTACNTL